MQHLPSDGRRRTTTVPPRRGEAPAARFFSCLRPSLVKVSLQCQREGNGSRAGAVVRVRALATATTSKVDRSDQEERLGVLHLANEIHDVAIASFEWDR